VTDNVRGIVICPVKALAAFRRELFGKLDYDKSEVGWLTHQEMEYDIDRNKIFVFTYTSLPTYYSLIEQLALSYHLVGIFDEAHKLNADAAKSTVDEDGNERLVGGSKSKKLLEDIKQYFKVIWLSTATPLINDIEGLYNIVTYLDPDFFGGKKAFYRDFVSYSLKKIWVKGGKRKLVKDTDSMTIKNVDVLKLRLQTICIMRQKKYNLKFAYVSDSLTDEELSIYEKASAGILSGDIERNFSGRLHDLQRVVDNSYSNDIISPESESTKEKMLFKSLKGDIC
jgi:hypothetical protein